MDEELFEVTIEEKTIELDEDIGYISGDNEVAKLRDEVVVLNDKIDMLEKKDTFEAVYSARKGVADYYQWDIAPTGDIGNGIGLFVTLCQNSGKIMPCTGYSVDPETEEVNRCEVFGVTVLDAAFIGGQDEKFPRGEDYALVATAGMVVVRSTGNIAVGDYVVSDLNGFAKKAKSSDYGYKVAALAEQMIVGDSINENIPNVVIDLKVSANQLDLIGDHIQNLIGRVEAAEVNSAAAAFAANQALKAATNAESNFENNMIDVNNKLDTTVDNVLGSVNGNVSELESKLTGQIKDIMDQTDIVYAKANEMQTIISQLDNKVVTLDKGIEERVAGIINTGDSFTTVVSSVDKYSVGKYSQSYGLTNLQAKNILKTGMIYIPTNHILSDDNPIAPSHIETFDDIKEENKFTPGYYYTWSKTGTDASGNGVFDWVGNLGGKQVIIQNWGPPTASITYKYWYIDSNEYTGINPDPSTSVVYEPYGLYISEYDEENKKYSWKKVNILSGNVNNRIVSMVRQTADSAYMEVVNAQGGAGSLGARLDEDKAVVEGIAKWMTDVDGNEYNLAYIKATADDVKSSIDLVVSKTVDGKVVNAGGIMLALTEEGSVAADILADRIRNVGVTAFASKNYEVVYDDYFAISSSNTVEPTDWDTEYPSNALELGKYIWRKTVKTLHGNPVQEVIYCMTAKDGTSVKILGSYDDEKELPSNYNGEIGDGFIIDSNLYVWTGVENKWKNVGQIKGEDGISVITYETQYAISLGDSKYVTSWFKNFDSIFTNYNSFKKNINKTYPVWGAVRSKDPGVVYYCEKDGNGEGLYYYYKKDDGDYTEYNWRSSSVIPYYIWSQQITRYSNGDIDESTPIKNTADSFFAMWCDVNNETKIDGSNVATGTITSKQLNTNAIKSLNYQPGATGSFLNLEDGSFDSKYLKWNERGSITAEDGVIGGWTIGKKELYNNTNSLESTNVGTYIGIDGIRQYNSDTSYIDIQNGKIVAMGADINGKITATKGSIGGWDISKTEILKECNGVYSGLCSSDLDGDVYYYYTRQSLVTPIVDDKRFYSTVRFFSGAPLHDEHVAPSHSTFIVLNDGSLYATAANIAGTIKAEKGSIGCFNIDNGIKGYVDGTESISLTNDGIILNNELAKIQVGNYETYYNASDKSTYLVTNGPLCIQGKESGTIISAIELMTEAGTVVEDVTIKVMAHRTSSATSSTWTITVLPSSNFLYPHTFTFYYQLNDGFGDWEDIQSHTFNMSTNASFTFTAKRINNHIRCSTTLSGVYSAYSYSGNESDTIVLSFMIQQRSTNNNINIIGNLMPKTSEMYNLGSNSYAWQGICSQTEVLVISDRNEKNTICNLGLEHDVIFDSLVPVRYKFNTNTSDRTHIGFVAQDVKSAIELAGITTKDFAAYCEWKKEDGNVGCGLRYGEFIALNTWQIQKAKARIAELENKILKLENMINKEN